MARANRFASPLNRTSASRRYRVPVFLTLTAVLGLLWLWLSDSTGSGKSSNSPSGASLQPPRSSVSSQRPATREATSKTIVIYAYYECNVICIRDFEYFLEVGVWESQEVDYYFVVNGQECTPCKTKQNIISKHRLEYRENKGADFGAYTHALQQLDLDTYQYFIFLNAGVKGPILPLYDIDKVPTWTRIFTSRLNDKVKMVGTTISCEVATHVQSHMFATDRVGLDIGIKNKIFHVHAGEGTAWDLIIQSEVGYSRMVLEAGFQLDSLLIRYAYTDWTPDSPGCNERSNPQKQNLYHTDDRIYGDINIDPLQVIFVKRGGNIRKDCLPQDVHCHPMDALTDATADWFERAVRRYRKTIDLGGR